MLLNVSGGDAVATRIETIEGLPCLPARSVRVSSKSKDGPRVRCNCPGGWHLLSDLRGLFRELGGKGSGESVWSDSGVAERMGAVGLRDVGQSMSCLERARGLPAMTHAWQVQWARSLRPHVRSVRRQRLDGCRGEASGPRAPVGRVESEVC